VPHINTRVSDELFEAANFAAIDERRPISAWVRVAMEEKLERDGRLNRPVWSRILGPVPTTSNVSPETEEELRRLSKDIAEETKRDLKRHVERQVSPNFKKGGKK
jgi:hypothetical protein